MNIWDLMDERFGKDNVLALATLEDGLPAVRYVNAYYERGAFYIITYALSSKMGQLAACPQAALAGEWFTGRGIGESLGWFCKPENAAIAAKLRAAFSQWIDNGHNNFADENTVILRITLTQAVLLSHGTRYEWRKEQ